jgi:hypothetical protein
MNIATEIALIAIEIRHTALDLSGLDLRRAKLKATRLTV